MILDIQTDANGDKYLFRPGDMGTYEDRTVGRSAVSGDPIVERRLKPGTAKFTGGTNGEGSPTLAMNHPPIVPEDIPAHIPWPRQAGPDPR